MGVVSSVTMFGVWLIGLSAVTADPGGAAAPSPSRGGPAREAYLHAYAGEKPKKVNAEDKTAAQQQAQRKQLGLARLRQHMPPLKHPRGDRWPIVLWTAMEEDAETWQASIDRGLSPSFRSCSTERGAEALLPALKHFQAKGVPLVILPQGWVQRAFRKPPFGTGCNHLPPARPAARTKEHPRAHHDFTCPAWMYDNPALETHGRNARRVCEFLKQHGIRPCAMWLDFETGVYLRNGAENEDRLKQAMAEALKCPRCLKRFGRDAMDTLVEYSALCEKARAHTYRVGLVDPVHAVFPGCHTGNFFAHPIRRQPPEPGRYPAYGWTASGFDVAQPRCYFIPGWGGNARNTQAEQDWNVFYYCVERFSRCAKVLEPGEIMVPWVAYLWRNRNALRRARAGAPIATVDAHREMAIHTLMRGAESFAIFTQKHPGDDLPKEYKRLAGRERGPFLLNVLGVQQGYDTMLAHHGLLRKGRVLNYAITGAYRQLDETCAVWSGVATDTTALVRTVTFGPELSKTIEIFGKKIELPFRKRGQFFRIDPDGNVRPLK